MRLLLVTGFLGAGKTTFLKRLLAGRGEERLALIVNEFGQTDVDGALLAGRGASVRMVTGGSAFCSCRLDQFEDALQAAARERPERILVEASGLSDPTAVRTVVEGFPEIEYAGCVALCDAPRLEKTLAAVRVGARQLAVSGLILLNKTDLVSPAAAECLAGQLRARYPQARIEKTVRGAFAPEWLRDLQARASAPFPAAARELALQKASVAVSPAMTRGECLQFLRLFAEDTDRIKGIVALREGTFLADCVGAALSLEPCPPSMNTGRLVALAGPGLPLRRSLLSAQKWYPDKVSVPVFGDSRVQPADAAP